MRSRVPKAIALSLCFCTLLFAFESGIWIDVPFVRQTKEGCGAASIAMVMQYWARQAGEKAGEKADAGYILTQLYSPEKHGISASAMERYLQQQGYRTFAIRGTLADLAQHLGKGRPLIVALRPQENSSALHYVVVAGLDSTRDLVMFNDPAGRKLEKLDRGTFEKEWNVTGNWTLLALPQTLGR